MTMKVSLISLPSPVVITLSVLLSLTTGWAHDCGPYELTVEKGDTVGYSITGHDRAVYEIVDKGDPLVAKIEPVVKEDVYDLYFEITGLGEGTTTFKVYWKGPQREDTCPVKVSVTG